MRIDISNLTLEQVQYIVDFEFMGLADCWVEVKGGSCYLVF